MAIFNFLSENIILPLGDLATGQSVAKHLKFLLQSQSWSANEIREFQEQRLKKIIRHSVETVPYYSELFNNHGIRIEDVKTVDDLKRIPILTKEIIKKEGLSRFISSTFPRNKRLQKSSSGSTGEPLFYYTTKDAYSMNIAANLRGWYDMGFRLGDRYIKLSQNPRKNPLKRLQDSISNNKYLATNPLVESNFEFILAAIEKYKPKIIRCYPDPLLFLARYRSKSKKFKYCPQAITTTGNTLFPEVREEIETAFGCKIFDSYSCEGNSTVFECHTHSCYHSAEEYGITEVLDENGVKITKGIGRLVSTDLWNLAHPFIRYDTQDYVEIDDSPCACGRSHLKILRILGRDNDVLVAPSGRKFIVHNFTGFFQTDHQSIARSVDQFQVVKYKDRVLFNLVVNDSYSKTVEEYIINFWQNEFGCPVSVSLFENIPLLKSGKRKFIINKEEIAE